MHIDRIHIFGFDACILETIDHNALCTQPFRMRSCNVVGVSGKASADHFGIDFSTSCLGMFQLFQDQGSCSFSENKAIPVFVKRTRPLFPDRHFLLKGRAWR